MSGSSVEPGPAKVARACDWSPSHAPRTTRHSPLRRITNAGSAIESSPVVVHGIDYFGTAGGRVYALDLRKQRVRWSRYLGAKITSSAAIAGKRLFIGDYAGRLWALSPATGATRWAGCRPWRTPVKTRTRIAKNGSG